MRLCFEAFWPWWVWKQDVGKRRISGRITWICQDKSYLISMRADRALEVVEVLFRDRIRTFGVYLPSETLGARRWCGNEMPLFEVKKTYQNCCTLWQRTKIIQTINLCCLFFGSLHSWKLTCPPKRDHFNRKYIFQPLIVRGYVSFREGRCCFPSWKTTSGWSHSCGPGAWDFFSFFDTLIYMDI